MSRQELDLGKLDQFTPRPTTGDASTGQGTDQPLKFRLQRFPEDPAPAGATAGLESGFPSREPSDEAQLNIKLPRAEAARFRRLAKANRYTLGAFLTLLMDGYEGRG